MGKPRIRILAGGPQNKSLTSLFYKTVIPKLHFDLIDLILQDRVKYIIKWHFDLKGNTLRIPANCIIEFDGGSILNGKIAWNNTQVFNLYDKEILIDIVESGTRTTFGGGI